MIPIAKKYTNWGTCFRTRWRPPPISWCRSPWQSPSSSGRGGSHTVNTYSSASGKPSDYYIYNFAKLPRTGILFWSVFWIWIRMDPGFFADPDLDFKNLDPDPSINKSIRSKWCFWSGFGGIWPKGQCWDLRVLNMKYTNFLLVLTVLGRFFMDLDPDSGKKSSIPIRKKTRIRNTDFDITHVIQQVKLR